MTKKKTNTVPAPTSCIAAYHAKDSQETAVVYDDWADEYEQHMKNVGYTASRRGRLDGARVTSRRALSGCLTPVPAPACWVRY